MPYLNMEHKTDLLFIFQTNTDEVVINIHKEDYEHRYEALILATKAFWTDLNTLKKWYNKEEDKVDDTLRNIQIIDLPDRRDINAIEQEYKQF